MASVSVVISFRCDGVRLSTKFDACRLDNVIHVIKIKVVLSLNVCCSYFVFVTIIH